MKRIGTSRICFPPHPHPREEPHSSRKWSIQPLKQRINSLETDTDDHEGSSAFWWNTGPAAVGLPALRNLYRWKSISHQVQESSWRWSVVAQDRALALKRRTPTAQKEGSVLEVCFPDRGAIPRQSRRIPPAPGQRPLVAFRAVSVIFRIWNKVRSRNFHNLMWLYHL